MSFTSILDLKEVITTDAVRDVFFTDLNLTQIIDTVSAVWGEDVTNFYRYFPLDFECEQYRREVFTDLCVPDTFAAFLKFYRSMQDMDRALSDREKVHTNLQRNIRLINAIFFYCDALSTLSNAIKSFSLSSPGLNAFKEALDLYCSTDEFKELYEVSSSVADSLGAFELSLVYDNNRVFLQSTEPSESVSDNFEDKLRRLYPDNEEPFKSPFMSTPELEGFERDVITLLMKKSPAVFKKISSLKSRHEDFSNNTFIRFYKEIGFYLSFISFVNSMKEKGFSFAIPTVNEDKRIEASGLYDLSLAILNSRRSLPVIDNDFYYDEDELFYVLTGPNQGGKTTFARSLGQLVFFTKMGLCVPAVRANLHYFNSIMTHFSVEESLETGRGKLMEELIRLKPMMTASDVNSFVIINELFTTAANYDACIMGTKVLKHFTQSGCHGIYVTHLSELLKNEEHAVGLCAALDENGIQTYKILRSIMEYETVASRIIDKYELSYEQLKERLSS